MKLQLSEKLRKLRKNADLTQEQLAAAFGVSPQSISKWECDEGYPDITYLPMIANYFGITIDELLGNDDEGFKLDMNKFYKTYYQLRYEDPAKGVEFATEYYRKYPKNYFLCSRLAEAIVGDRAHLPENLPLLRETCEKILAECTEQYLREDAIRFMCLCCNDDELDKWLNMTACNYEAYRNEILEQRQWDMGRHEESRLTHDINNFRLVIHFLGRENRNWAAAKKASEWSKYRLRMIETFGENGEIPKGWWGQYTSALFRTACALFGNGDIEEGYEYLDRAFEFYPKWLDIPDGEPLDVGNPFIFGGIKIKKHVYGKVILPDGAEMKLDDPSMGILNIGCDLFHYAMTAQGGWEWFNGVRDTDRFQSYVARAKEILEKYRCDKDGDTEK